METEERYVGGQHGCAPCQRFDAHHFIQFVKRRGDPDTYTGSEKLRFISYGSPILRYILYQIHTYILPHNIMEKSRRLLITEELLLEGHY